MPTAKRYDDEFAVFIYIFILMKAEKSIMALIVEFVECSC